MHSLSWNHADRTPSHEDLLPVLGNSLESGEGPRGRMCGTDTDQPWLCTDFGLQDDADDDVEDDEDLDDDDLDDEDDEDLDDEDEDEEDGDGDEEDEDLGDEDEDFNEDEEEE